MSPLGYKRRFGASLVRSASGGTADVNRRKADIAKQFAARSRISENFLRREPTELFGYGGVIKEGPALVADFWSGGAPFAAFAHPNLPNRHHCFKIARTVAVLIRTGNTASLDSILSYA